MCNAIGAVNYKGPNVQIKGMQDCHSVFAFSFLGRYRPVDSPIPNLGNSGINHIEVFVRTSPRSLLERPGIGRHYNIDSKHGKLHILPIESMDENDFYNSDINSCMYNIRAIEDANYPYIVLTPSYFVFRQDFSMLPDAHIESDADIAILHQNVDNAKKSFVNCDVVSLNKQKDVLSLKKNRGSSKSRTISLKTYILSKELFMGLVKRAVNVSSLYWLRDIVDDECVGLNIRDAVHRGFVACINDFESYYSANTDLLGYDKAMDLFHIGRPVYARTNNSCPTQYYAGVSMKNSMASNGCLVESDTENSVIGRGAIIKKGAVMKNCMILPGTMIGEDVYIENVVVDKKAGIVRRKELLNLTGTPLYMKRNDKV